METIPASDFYGHTLFCDDIRPEASGKINFVGTYTTHMVVHGLFPFLLPKFGIWIQYNQHRDKVITPVRFAIFVPGDKDDEPSIVTQVPDEAVEDAIQKAKERAKQNPQDEEKDPSFIGLGNHTLFSPFVIAEPGLIRVRAIREDKFVRLGALRVIPAPSQTS
jgi:hypothetical protein